MSLILLSLLLLGQSLITNATDNATWPNAYPKQLAVVRRRSGLTTAEYLYHHTLVHGAKSWNAPDTVDQPLAYIQDHVFDSAYGINTSANNPAPSYFGHTDMTELYSRSAQAFNTTPTNNYTAAVIGPDGNAFSDFSAAFSMYAFEEFEQVEDNCVLSGSSEVFNAFFWVFAEATDSATSTFDNATFAAPIMESFLAAFPPGTIYNASTHTSVPGLDSRPYYGGANNPSINAVLKFWLCDDDVSVSAFRRAQLRLGEQNGHLGINLQESFVLFTRGFLVYDRTTQTGFSRERGIAALLADQRRGDVAGPPVVSH
jgi:hypothetical protein